MRTGSPPPYPKDSQRKIMPAPTQAARKAKILFLDIETLPNISYTWGKYEQNVIAFKQEGCIATYAAKWLGGKVFSKSLPDYKGYEPWSYDDSHLVADLWKLFDEAEIIVAHYGDSFDIKYSNARFIFHRLKPPSPYKTVDTKKVAKRVARFNSNKLDDIGELLGIGRKIKTDFSLWQGCMKGDKKSWSKMCRYNEMDVILLEKTYHQLLPWMKNHPNIGTITSEFCCPKCGSKALQSRGMAITSSMKYRRFQCQECGGWTRETMNGFKPSIYANAQ
jgi:predicted RNA-binding Zn-ribbon protein involved in translation (DUF1610 family)